MRYVIKLGRGNGYLCHTGTTNTAVIYKIRGDITERTIDTGILAMDVQASGGIAKPLEGETYKEIFEYGWYDNKDEDLTESLKDYATFKRKCEEATIYL